jgi:hypothetical protein
MNRQVELNLTDANIKAIDDVAEWLKEDYRFSKNQRVWELCMDIQAIAVKFEDALRPKDAEIQRQEDIA